MSSSIASTHLFSLLSWAFLPALLSRFLLTTYYRLLPSSRPTISPTSPPAEIAHQNSRAQAHSRNARVLLIGLYLAYTILSTYFAQSQGTARNFYTLLGINRTVVENEGAQAVKSHWRKLARLYHPDKIGKAGEQYFVELRRGVECLEDEGKRWAYERFGPVVLEWGKMKGNREWLVRGAYQSVVFYVFAFLSIWLLSIVRKEERANGFVRPSLPRPVVATNSASYSGAIPPSSSPFRLNSPSSSDLPRRPSSPSSSLTACPTSTSPSSANSSSQPPWLSPNSLLSSSPLLPPSPVLQPNRHSHKRSRTHSRSSPSWTTWRA